MTDRERHGLLIILSSPSGAGKSTLTKKIMAQDRSIRFSVSATTRAPRAGEIDGQDYYFMTRDGFEAKVASGDMLEHAEVFGHFYGTPKAPVEQAVVQGCDTIFDIDWQGGQQIRRSSLGAHVVSIFILPPSIAALEQRLRGRAQDTEDVIRKRMAKCKDEISHWAEYDYVIVNRDADAAAAEIRTILSAERSRADRLPGLNDFVRRLNKEFEAK